MQPLQPHRSEIRDREEHGAGKRPGRAPHLRLVPDPRRLPPLLCRRNPSFIRWLFPKASWITDRYFRAEVQGVEHLQDGACLVVSTHNGGVFMPDIIALWVAFWRRFGVDYPWYSMTHKAALRIPGYGSMARWIGALEASTKNGKVALEAGYPLFTCPGGDVDVLKPYRLRHRVIFGGRKGFVRLALQQQVPIIPVVSVGAHEVFYMINDGRRLARITGADRLLRIKSIPFALSFPFGLTPAGLFCIPLPSRVTVRILPPVELLEPAAAVRDEKVVRRCYSHVQQTMQRALDDLASRRIWPVLG